VTDHRGGNLNLSETISRTIPIIIRDCFGASLLAASERVTRRVIRGFSLEFP
jgi:hypothetical protein